jgi:hypothetical protein
MPGAVSTESLSYPDAPEFFGGVVRLPNHDDAILGHRGQEHRIKRTILAPAHHQTFELAIHLGFGTHKWELPTRLG